MCEFVYACMFVCMYMCMCASITKRVSDSEDVWMNLDKLTKTLSFKHTYAHPHKWIDTHT